MLELPKTKGGFKAIEADPAWPFRSYAPVQNPELDRRPERHYSTMTVDDIAAMPVKEIAAPDAHLFLWIPWPLLFQGERVMNAWGFRYSGVAFNWVKLRKAINLEHLCQIGRIEDELHMGLGFTTRANSEICLLGRRGNAKRVAKNVREMLVSPALEDDMVETVFAQRREHSRKPDEIYDRIQRYCDGPYLSLFSRQQRPGWTVWGNQVEKFK